MTCIKLAEHAIKHAIWHHKHQTRATFELLDCAVTASKPLFLHLLRKSSRFDSVEQIRLLHDIFGRLQPITSIWGAIRHVNGEISDGRKPISSVWCNQEVAAWCFCKATNIKPFTLGKPGEDHGPTGSCCLAAQIDQNGSMQWSSFPLTSCFLTLFCLSHSQCNPMNSPL